MKLIYRILEIVCILLGAMEIWFSKYDAATAAYVLCIICILSNLRETK